MDLVTNVVKEAAVEASTSLLAEIKKHVAYLYKYEDNLEDLEKARILLDATRRDASNYSVDAEKRFKKVGEAFVLWQSEADKLHQKAENIISKNNISCFQLWSRYSTSKHAWELSQDIHEKVDKAPDFGNSFDIGIPEGAKFNLTDFTDFDSRKEILKKVLKALEDEHVSMCSICGMGGIGKTTMAQNIVQIVEAGHFFDKVAMVTVSQNPNFENIQKAIMEKLGLPIGESDMSTRANKLNHWLSNHKTLLILDDVWDSLLEKFDDVGIPLAKNMCKIVVTSRNEHECKKMGSKPIFCLKVLDGREAWDLFIKIAGNLQETAREIVRECNGLPIAIVTIARALTDKPAGAWRDSLKKLRNSNLLGIPDMDSVYKKIEVSYDLLKDPEAQSCLRYCCLFPEDYNVPVEKLVFYGWGLELFKGVESLKEARDRVDSIVDKLKKSFLLLDGEGDGDGYVKLHDIVRDFAIWISLNDIHLYIVKCNKEMEKWPEACELEKCSAISIVCNTIQDVIPVELRCPNLELLQLHVRDDSCELPNGFLEGMEELRVVDLQLGSQLPQLTRQKNLRTLLIEGNRERKMVDPIYIREILGNGDMKNLEIFSLSYTHFSDFPEEIGKLCNLRCLRFKDHVRFEYIPPDVLSKLVKLEELRLPLPFINWGRREVWGDRRVNASLNEIESLPLNSIDITVPKGSILTEKLVSGITRF